MLVFVMLSALSITKLVHQWKRKGERDQIDRDAKSCWYF